MNSTMGEETSSEESKQAQNSREETSATGKQSLRRAIDLTSSLISLSHSIKVFSAKWQLIRNKLDELLSSLDAVENCDAGDEDSVSDGVETITATLNECSDLAKRCMDLSYSGKLLMQSDLNIISTKLENHTKSLSEIYAAGSLSLNHAIVVSRPGFSASREDMKFYIRDLLSRLKIGGVEMRKEALIAFSEVIQEDERYIKISVEAENFISLLVNFLDSQDIEIQELASKSLSVIAGLESYRGELVGAGIIAPLIRVLECGSESGKESAARSLMKLTENSNNSWSVSAHGGATALLNVCINSVDSVGGGGGELVGLACGVLKNIVGVEEIKRFMVEEGAISGFIKLARSEDEALQINSIDFLQAVASGDESIREMIVRECGIRVLVGVLDPKSLSSSKAREVAFKAIVNLCFSSEKSLNMLMNFGFLDHILYFLRNGELLVQEMALKAAFWLCRSSEEAKKAMGDAGFMPELVKFLDSKSFVVREMAAEALSSLVLVPRNRKRFVQNDQNVGLLLQLLDPEEANSGSRKLLLSILMSLTRSSSGRKKIANSGHLKNIQKLAEAEVSDAKKIVRKLSSNRFRNILSGIWHS